MQAVVIDPQVPQRVGFRTVEPPTPRPTEALVRVKAVSLNRGEVVYRVQGAAGTPLGGIWPELWTSLLRRHQGLPRGPGWPGWCVPAPGPSKRPFP
jgi:NADPH:quinone reductase-like Zn-dependent oxidoreductase